MKQFLFLLVFILGKEYRPRHRNSVFYLIPVTNALARSKERHYHRRHVRLAASIGHLSYVK